MTVQLEPTEFAAKTSFKKRFDYKKKQFHINNQVSSSFQQKFKCSNCGRLNHRTNECFALGGAKFKQKAINVSSFATHHILSTSENNWKMEKSIIIIDSGCTSHILCCDKYFTNITVPGTDLTVSNRDLSNQKVCGIGTAMIPLVDKNGQSVNLSLEKALYVPTFHFNLLSVDHLVSAGNKKTFEPCESIF